MSDFHSSTRIKQSVLGILAVTCLLSPSVVSGFFVSPLIQKQHHAATTAATASMIASSLPRRAATVSTTVLQLAAAGDGDEKVDDEAPKKKRKSGSGGGKQQTSKEDLIKAVGEQMRSKKGGGAKAPAAADAVKGKAEGAGGEASLLDRLNPFKAGQEFRKAIDTTLESIGTGERKAMYLLDDRLNEGGGGSTAFERNPALERLEQDDFVPEVLVVGATGEVGRLVVRRLLLDGRFRVRVLVRNLYTKTLNILGTGVTYCQGDLSNPDSLEYALTDVDKIIFCASAPRSDEDAFQQKFEDFMKETLESQDLEIQEQKIDSTKAATSMSEWEQLESVLEVRSRLAEQVDCIGMQNLVRAYQDVRVADYGTSQSAKRSLFKFQDRPEDFNLFSIDDDDNDEKDADKVLVATSPIVTTGKSAKEYDEDNYDDYSDYDEEYGAASVESRRGESVKTQVQWIKNQFEHGVFVGKVPKGGDAAVVSSRLRSRDNPDNGIDLSASFAGFIGRVCSDGGVYEAFVRTGAYFDDGIEYVCEFSTATKPIGKNKSPNKFTTVRLPFESFKPIQRKQSKGTSDTSSIRPFRGQDVRQIGFRYRSAANELKSKLEPGEWSSFYLALCYVKLYRSQPEPEFVYVSDARIPPVVRNGMVRHNSRMLVTSGGGAGGDGDADDGGVQLFDESTLKTVLSKDKVARSAEETYYKFRGEEIIKNSGLSYSIVRIPGYNEVPSGEASTIDLRSEPGELTAVSRAEVAQICVSALLDPNALNKSFYMGKKKVARSSSVEDDISAKFAALPTDAIV